MNVPTDAGKVPYNMESNYGSMTAKEWKNWVLIYSMYCLDGVLPQNHIAVWQTFVLSCKYFCQLVISDQDLSIAHNLIVKFCNEAEKLYGSEFVSPNMHLHCHLQQSIRDYGSIYGFWLFSFERFNGMLADFPTNKRSIVVQIMKFQEYAFINDSSKQDLVEFSNLFSQFLTK